MIGYRTQTGIGRRSIDVGPGDPSGYGGPERRKGIVRRVGGRARSLLSGKVAVRDGELSYDCVIRNLSPLGARISLSNSIELPAEVGLLVIREGLLCEATVVWRRGDQAGLKFHGRHDLRRDTDPARRGVRALWMALAPL